MSNGDQNLDDDPPREAPGVRTDLFEHPDREALAGAFSHHNDHQPEPLEDPPREFELHSPDPSQSRSAEAPDADRDPPRESEAD